ncbi:hypothetical protein CEXT_512061 [Caerostris extrusa]|uniref:Uncharacterized protein n=1 Tax=Caerostris extrusa TaxID=172846 RepID=A0AAV4X9L6_CAEEX|nr:hypothetical protein CEXT_512061 [Caerostris extrusa]
MSPLNTIVAARINTRLGRRQSTCCHSSQNSGRAGCNSLPEVNEVYELKKSCFLRFGAIRIDGATVAKRAHTPNFGQEDLRIT